jgi:RHS repeat-associated protein
MKLSFEAAVLNTLRMETFGQRLVERRNVLGLAGRGFIAGVRSSNSKSTSYDSVGELTSDGTNAYTWNARHELTQIKQGRTVTAAFTYDAFGRRESKSIGTSTTDFLYDGLNPVQEQSSGGSVTANLLTGLNIDEFFARTASGTTSTFLADALGSTIGLVTANGGPIATSYTYKPFGNTTAGGASNANPFQFTGRENDGNGLYYYRARYYSPTFQRFVSQDPLGLAGGDTNFYRYSHSDPVSSRDPFGLSVLFAGSGGSSATGSFGATSSGGVYYDPVNGGGTFETSGGAEGATAGLSGYAGYYSGDYTGFAGETDYTTYSVGPVEVTFSNNEGGWGVSVGFALGLPIGISHGSTNTNLTGPGNARCAPPVTPEYSRPGPFYSAPTG